MRLAHADDASFSFAGPRLPEEHRPCIPALERHSACGWGIRQGGTMNFRHRTTPEVALNAGQVLTLDDAEGVRIASRGGTVWVTQEGSSKDFIVGPGDALVV
ncbi:MAG: DUF2917 domain-containing protein, partial [Usitatibacter sp.]